MLKCNIDRKKNRVRVKAKGTAHDLMVETSCLISDIYRNINAAVPDAAQVFKNALIGVLLDPKSPVWKVETNHETDSV